MRKQLIPASLVLGTLAFTVNPASAQEVVHALAGKVTAVYPATKMIKVATDDGSGNLFEILTKANTPLTFQKNVRALTTPADSFNKTNDQVVLFYYGQDNVRTAVAVEDLGASPLTRTVGTVVSLDKRGHVVTIKTDAGAEQTFHVDDKTVVDGYEGVAKGDNIDVAKGAKVRIVASGADGAQTALFIRALSL